MKRLRISALAVGLAVGLFVVLALMLGMSKPAYADPPDPEGVNQFDVSPDPQTAGEDVTIDVNVDINTADSNTRFCYYTPDTGSDFTVPSVITLTYTSDFVSTDVGFNKLADASPCPNRSGQDKWVYSTTNAYVGSITYEGSFTTTISSDASAGYYDWTILLEEPTGTPNPLSYNNHEIQAAPTTIYASDKGDCEGYGTSGSSCFGSLQDAIDAVSSGNDVVIVGTLTADSGGSSVSGSNVSVIRGIESPQLVAPSGCTNATLLTIDKSSVTVRDFTIDGSSCSGAAMGIDVTSTGATIDSMTVQNFSGGTGIKFSSGGAGTVKNCTGSIANNSFGVQIANGAGTVNIGAGPSDGNTFTNNTMGIQVADTDAVIKGNTVSGGSTGIALNAAPSAIYGNSVTGASSNHIYCNTGNGVTNGAAFNYLGGNSPSSGSNCDDVDDQLGAMWTTWVDRATSLNEVTSAPAGSAIFDLGDNKPFGVGTPGSAGLPEEGGMDQLLSNFYAIRTSGSSVTIDFSGSGTGRLYHIDTPSECTSSGETDCWDYTGDESSDSVTDADGGSGHYVVGAEYDPTAITLTNVTAQSPRQWLPVALAALALAGAGGALLALRRRYV